MANNGNEGNGGPGDTYVSTGWVVTIATYLILLTIIIFTGIYYQWPVCDLNCKGSPATANDNSNTNDNANANKPANTNAAANTNANANSNANANANANVANSNSNSSKPAEQKPSEQKPSENASQSKADMDSIAPASGSINGGTQVTIKGKGFADGDVVEFDGVEAKITRLSAESISARTPCHEGGVVNVTIRRKNATKDDDFLDNAYTYTCPAPEGRHLFLLIIFAGALGGVIHAGRSLWWYVGHRDLKWSWALMYLILPFGGSAMAVVFYLIIIAGFLPNVPSANMAVFVIAVAALVGLFSQQAALKLTDIANAFFTKPGQGSDAKPQKSLPVGATEPSGTPALTVTKLSKMTGAVAGNEEVIITGTGFSDPATVKFGDATATVKAGSVTATSITVTTPAHKAEEVDVEVKCGGVSAKLPGKFKYT